MACASFPSCFSTQLQSQSVNGKDRTSGIYELESSCRECRFLTKKSGQMGDPWHLGFLAASGPSQTWSLGSRSPPETVVPSPTPKPASPSPGQRASHTVGWGIGVSEGLLQCGSPGPPRDSLIHQVWVRLRDPTLRTTAPHGREESNYTFPGLGNS